MRTTSVRWAATGLIALLLPGGTPAPAQAPPPVQSPVLKWANKGCTSFCQTGWYSSPAVADLDGDGQPEVIWGSYDLVVLNGSTGALRVRAPSSFRVWPGVAVADIDNNGSLEIVVGRNDGSLTAYEPTVTVPGGTMTLPLAWPAVNPFGAEIRSLAVDDLDGNGTLETIVGRASGGNDQQVAVYNSNGALRAGWPAPANGAPGFGAGMYNENLTIGDLDGNGVKEIFAPTDTHYITALNPDGSQIGTNAQYDNAFNPMGPKFWRQVGVHVDQAADLAGFAVCGVQHRPNFANMGPANGDFDGDGTLELAFPGDAYDCALGDGPPPEGDYAILPWILKRDRSRWSGSGYDWTVIPTPKPGSLPLSEDFDLIENSVSNAVIADLDGDGQREFIYPAYDGKMHAWWLDKTQHGNWPYTVPGTGFRFASEPVVADLNGDGQAEVIFTSWGQKDTATRGQLHVLDSMGNSLFAIDLPDSFPTGDWNGGLPAPTIANIDGDADYELVVGTSQGGVVAYDLPGTAAARIQWGTGRGSYRRTGLQPEEIFNDGFELGGLSRWSSAVTDGGNLSVTPGAALAGSQGLQAVVNDTNPLYVQDDGPDHERHYRARFSINPSLYDPGEAASHFRTRVFLVFQGVPNRRVAAVVLKRQAGVYSVMVRARRDDNSQADTAFVTIPSAPTSIEIDLRAASAPGANDGRAELFVNGVSAAVTTGIDNDTARADYVRLGAMNVKTGASGTLLFDRFVSQRRSRIGQ